VNAGINVNAFAVAGHCVSSHRVSCVKAGLENGDLSSPPSRCVGLCLLGKREVSLWSHFSFQPMDYFACQSGSDHERMLVVHGCYDVGRSSEY
jgi:hypothetical protein